MIDDKMFDKIVDCSDMPPEEMGKTICDALASIPPTFERLKNDDEWLRKNIVNIKYITGYFACWAVRQLQSIPYSPNLEKIIGYLNACLRREFLKQADDKWHREGWGDYSLCEINKMLHDILMDDQTFLEWNTEKVMGKDWLDLEALLHNVCISLRDEIRSFNEFNRRFEEHWNGCQDGGYI